MKNATRWRGTRLPRSRCAAGPCNWRRPAKQLWADEWGDNVADAPSGSAFELAQFRRAIADGTFTWLSGTIKSSVHSAYAAIGDAIASAQVFIGRWQGESAAIRATAEARVKIDAAIACLQAESSEP